MGRKEVSAEGGELTGRIRIPADFEPHTRTIMAWAIHNEWGSDRERVERELDTVVRAIADCEPVLLLTPPEHLRFYRVPTSVLRGGAAQGIVCFVAQNGIYEP
ncbi:agmatine deiminase family protein [Bradyrhizobium sp. HKCCYLRH2015]|uniref:agmatine deiminase family protein n=1 Tax=Bradyrhizobium TaxID=374 RepID=UPI003EC11B2F